MNHKWFFVLLPLALVCGCASSTPAPEASRTADSVTAPNSGSLAEALKICESQIGSDQIRSAVLYAADLLLADLRESDLYDGPTLFCPIFRDKIEFVELVEAFPWIRQERKKEIEQMFWIARSVGMEQPLRAK